MIRNDREDCICGFSGQDLMKEAFSLGLNAGNTIDCPECQEELYIYEHSDGWATWMTFEAHL